MNVRRRYAPQPVLDTAAAAEDDDDVKGNEGEKMFFMSCASVSDVKAL